MTAVIIYGVSDDLIEVEGDLNEEFNPDSDDQDTWLVFGDGTILAIRYDEFGIWRITRPFAGSGSFLKKEAIGDEGKRDDGKPAYSDIAEVTGDLKWVIAAEKVSFHKITASATDDLGSLPEKPSGGAVDGQPPEGETR